MNIRRAAMGILLGGAVLGGVVMGQQNKPMVGGTGSGAPTAGGAIGQAVEREVKGLTAEDFPEREAAIKRLQAIIAEQVKQRAQVQEIIDALQRDLGQQEKALAMVTDEEAQGQIAGLLEMERGLAGWTIQTMAEPVERRGALLTWGMGREAAPILARAYSGNKRIRLTGIKELEKLPDEGTGGAGGAGWTLSRLINDSDAMVRAAAMAVAWSRKPDSDVVGALWFRGVAGPLARSEEPEALHPETAGEALHVDFPEGEPLEFSAENDSGEFGDALLAADVLVHIHSPLVAERIKRLIEERGKAGKNLTVSDDPDWTLATHRLVESYLMKEAVPMLAGEALGTQHDEMGGEMNGRPYVWSQRTMAIGALLKVVGKNPTEYQLMRVRGGEDLRGWIWGTDVAPGGPGGGGRPTGDGAPVRAFYDWWKDHHGEYGVKEEPSAAGVPVPGRGRGRRGGPAADPMVLPAPGAGQVPMPEGPPAVGR